MNMTDKEIKKIEKELYAKQNLTHKDEVLLEEMKCRSMINSCLIYGYGVDKGSYAYEKYIEPFTYDKTWHFALLTEKKIEKLIKEQKAEIEKATIHVGVGTDGEGCSYNSITWAD